MLRNAGLPSLRLTFSVISMPRTSLPSHVLFGSVISRTRLGVLGGELLELGVVVGERAVGVAAAREGRSGWRGRRSARSAARCARLCATRSGTSTRQRKPALRSACLVVGAVEDDAEASPCRRARSCRGRARAAGPCCACVGVMTLTSCGGLAFASSSAPGADRGELERGGHGGGVAGAPAGLHVERAAGRVADGDLLRVGRRVGGERAAGRRRTPRRPSRPRSPASLTVTAPGPDTSTLRVATPARPGRYARWQAVAYVPAGAASAPSSIVCGSSSGAGGERGRAGASSAASVSETASGERGGEGSWGCERARASRSGGDCLGVAARGDAPPRLPGDRPRSSTTGRRCPSGADGRGRRRRRRCGRRWAGRRRTRPGDAGRRVGPPVRRGAAVDGDEHPPALVRAHPLAVELRVGAGRRGVVRVQPARDVVGRRRRGRRRSSSRCSTGCASWCGMPAGTEGLLTSGGSMASLTALVAAREARGGGRRRVPVATRRTARSCGT